jgi:hypothetical protein
MLKFLKQSWWKLLGVLLLLYSTSAALLIPLSSGIQKVSPETLQAGDTYQVNVYGYNSHYKPSDPSLVLLLKNDRLQFCSQAIEVVNASHFIAQVEIPENIEVGESDQQIHW